MCNLKIVLVCIKHKRDIGEKNETFNSRKIKTNVVRIL